MDFEQAAAGTNLRAGGWSATTGLPAWLRPLVANVHDRELPGRLHDLVGLAPAEARRGAVLMLFGDGPGRS